MLRLEGVQTQCLFDQVLPDEVRELPEELARLDELLADPALHLRRFCLAKELAPSRRAAHSAVKRHTEAEPDSLQAAGRRRVPRAPRT